MPQQKRLCAVLPAAVAEALAAPRPAEVVFPWLLVEARQRDPDHQHAWVLLMDGQPALWDAAAAASGDKVGSIRSRPVRAWKVRRNRSACST